MKPMRVNPYEGMNQTEARYARNLDLKMLSGVGLIEWRFDEINLRLGNNLHYRPDFFLVFVDHFEMHEVKGFWREDARAKIKMAVRLFPWFRWRAVQWKKKRWVFEDFN